MLKTLFLSILITAATAQENHKNAKILLTISHKSKKSNNIKHISKTPMNNYWEVKLSTTEIAEIKKQIQIMPQIRGIHLTSWVAGNQKLREKILKNIANSVINAVAVAIKEKDGKVYIPGIEKTKHFGSQELAIPNPQKMIEDFNKLKLYKIARIVCFHDNVIPKKFPELAVKKSNGLIWKSKKGDMWVDPYNKKIWEYILDVAEESAELGFDEIQFDYVRYPTEGNTQECVFSKKHNRENANKNIADFLKYAKERLKKYKLKISVDVFGLTTSSDMGIGQDLNLLAQNVDYIYPMMYPSHYYTKVYNLENPESQPYKVIDRGLKEALNKTKLNYVKIRPYLQDFSLKQKYGPQDIRAQIIAARANMLESWILWNPKSEYSWSTLTPQIYKALIAP